MHHWNYLLIILVFPILLSGAFILPAIITNKKFFFFFVPLVELFLFYKILCVLLPWEQNSFVGIVKTMLSSQLVIHLPVIFIPALIFSILSAHIASGYVTRFHEMAEKRVKKTTQKYYRDLSYVEHLEERHKEQSVLLHYEIVDGKKKITNYLFDSFSGDCYELQIENNFPNQEFDEDTATLIACEDQEMHRQEKENTLSYEEVEDGFNEESFEDSDTYQQVTAASV